MRRRTQRHLSPMRFLTYPRCALSLEEYKALLLDQFPEVRYWLISRELHADGVPHLHVFMEFTEPRVIKITDLVLGGYRPNVQIPRSRYKVIRYVKKGGSFLTNLPSGSQAVAALNKVLLSRPLSYLLEHGYLALTQVPYWSYGIHLYGQYLPARAREVTPIWLWGPSGSGKTFRTLKTYPGHYVKDSSHPFWDGYFDHQAVAIHEISPATFKEHRDLASKLKNWLDPFPAYGSFPIKGSVITPRYDVIIVTSQYSPQDLWRLGKQDPRDLEALLRRLQDRIHYVEDNLQDIPGLGQGYLTNFN